MRERDVFEVLGVQDPSAMLGESMTGGLACVPDPAGSRELEEAEGMERHAHLRMERALREGDAITARAAATVREEASSAANQAQRKLAAAGPRLAERSWRDALAESGTPDVLGGLA